MERIVRGLAAAAAMALASACAGACAGQEEEPETSPAAEARESRPDVSGTITRLDTLDGIGGRVAEATVEANPLEESGSAKARVTITTATRIFVDESDVRRPATLDELRRLRTVDVWFEGPVMESYPVQATAARVVVRP